MRAGGLPAAADEAAVRDRPGRRAGDRAGLPHAARSSRSSSTPARASCSSSLGRPGGGRRARAEPPDDRRSRSALIVVVGTPAAWLLATRRFRGRALAITLVELPLVLPPAVAGHRPAGRARARTGLLGGALERRGRRAGVPDRRGGGGAGVRGQPLLHPPGAGGVRGARPVAAARRRARSARARPRTFARVAVPNAMPGLVAGGALAWGRALGEFGATLVFAGSLSGRHPDGAARDLRALRRRLHRARWRCPRC